MHYFSQLLLSTTQQFVYSTGEPFKQTEIVVEFKPGNLQNAHFSSSLKYKNSHLNNISTVGQAEVIQS